jgi:hypothetical protein
MDPLQIKSLTHAGSLLDGAQSKLSACKYAFDKTNVTLHDVLRELYTFRQLPPEQKAVFDIGPVIEMAEELRTTVFNPDKDGSIRRDVSVALEAVRDGRDWVVALSKKG